MKPIFKKSLIYTSSLSLSILISACVNLPFPPPKDLKYFIPIITASVDNMYEIECYQKGLDVNSPRVKVSPDKCLVNTLSITLDDYARMKERDDKMRLEIAKLQHNRE